jgi:hypothetical protein
MSIVDLVEADEVRNDGLRNGNQRIDCVLQRGEVVSGLSRVHKLIQIESS